MIGQSFDCPFFVFSEPVSIHSAFQKHFFIVVKQKGPKHYGSDQACIDFGFG